MKSRSKNMPPAMKFVFKWIFPYIFVITGAITAFLGIRDLILANASTNWPSTQGQIIESSVESHQSSGKNGNSTTYQAKIQYKFTLDDNTFNGTCVSYGDYGSSDPSHAEKIVNKYPKGLNIDVYYMSDTPEECVLEPGIKTQAYFLPAFGLLFITTGSLMAIFLPKLIKKQEILKEDSSI